MRSPSCLLACDEVAEVVDGKSDPGENEIRRDIFWEYPCHDQEGAAHSRSNTPTKHRHLTLLSELVEVEG